MRLRRLFWKLVLAFLLVTLLGTGARSVALSYFTRDFFATQLAKMMTEDARGITMWATEYLPAKDWTGLPDLRQHLPWLSAVSEGRLWLINAEGLVLADTGDDTSWRGVRLHDPSLSRVLHGETVTVRDTPWFADAIMVGAPVLENGKVVGGAILFASPARLEALVAEFQPVVLYTAMVSFGFSMLVAFLLSRSLARPIIRMRDFARRLGQREFDGPDMTADVEEMQQLGAALRDAAAQLRDSFDALTEEKQRVQMLLQAMGEGVVAVDEAGRVQAMNPAAGRLLGVSEAAPAALVAEAGIPGPLTGALQRAASAQVHQVEEILFQCGGREIRSLVSTVAPGQGRATGAVAVLQDVTAETRLRRMQENFVANVSHELRAPLASLSAGVEAMHDGLIKPRERQRYLALMLLEITRLRRLTEDLLALSRMDAGITHLSQEEFDVAEVIREVVETFSPRAHAQGVVMVARTEPAPVIANRDRVAEVLANLLDNAIRYTPSGGSVRVTPSRQGEMVQIRVQDTGVGIEADHLPHIWDRFYKVDAARTRTMPGGTGLGLSIAKQLVEQMGGEVMVESAPGAGSVFAFTLVAGGDSIG